MTAGAIFGPVQKLAPLIVAFYVLVRHAIVRSDDAQCNVSFDWLRDNPYDKSAGVAMLVIAIPLLIILGAMQLVLSIENWSIARKLRETRDVPAGSTPRSNQPKSVASSFSGTLSLFRAIAGQPKQNRDQEEQIEDLEKQQDDLDASKELPTPLEGALIQIGHLGSGSQNEG